MMSIKVYNVWAFKGVGINGFGLSLRTFARVLVCEEKNIDDRKK